MNGSKIYVSITLFVFTWSLKSIGFCGPESESRHDLRREEPLWIAKSLIRNFDDLADFTQTENKQIEIEIPGWLAIKEQIDPWCEEIEEEVK